MRRDPEKWDGFHDNEGHESMPVNSAYSLSNRSFRPIAFVFYVKQCVRQSVECHHCRRKAQIHACACKKCKSQNGTFSRKISLVYGARYACRENLEYKGYDYAKEAPYDSSPNPTQRECPFSRSNSYSQKLTHCCQYEEFYETHNVGMRRSRGYKHFPCR